MRLRLHTSQTCKKYLYIYTHTYVINLWNVWFMNLSLCFHLVFIWFVVFFLSFVLAICLLWLFFILFVFVSSILLLSISLSLSLFDLEQSMRILDSMGSFPKSLCHFRFFCYGTAFHSLSFKYGPYTHIHTRINTYISNLVC